MHWKLIIVNFAILPNFHPERFLRRSYCYVTSVLLVVQGGTEAAEENEEETEEVTVSCAAAKEISRDASVLSEQDGIFGLK